MYTGTIAGRYAQALLRFASSNGEEDVVYSQVKELVEHFKANPSIKKELDSPILSAKVKLAVLYNGVKGDICRSLGEFLSLTARHGREKFIIFMLHSFIGMYERKHGIASVVLTTAVPADDATMQGIASMVKEKTGSSSVRMESNVDEKLIGGFVLRIADMQMDASVATQLKGLQETLLEKL